MITARDIQIVYHYVERGENIHTSLVERAQPELRKLGEQGWRVVACVAPYERIYVWTLEREKQVEALR